MISEGIVPEAFHSLLESRAGLHGTRYGAGKSGEAWVREYWEKKNAGETNILWLPTRSNQFSCYLGSDKTGISVIDWFGPARNPDPATNCPLAEK